jgi:hypothetical protein
LAKLPPQAGAGLSWCGLLLLTACAASAKAPLPLANNTATPKGTIISGVVVAIRPVTAQSALAPSSAAVLAALQLPIPKQSPDATEFVVQRGDGNIAAIVLASPVSSPDASLAAANFSLGDQVELITGEQTVLIHRSP